MKKFTLFFALICLAVLSSFSSIIYFTEWELRKNKDGIKIYTREASNTNLKEVKTVLTINASIPDITMAIIDVENYSSWMQNIVNPKILKKVNDSEYYLYYEMEAPWPTDNRDIVNRTIVSHNKTDNTTIITSVAAPDYIKKKENIVRITLSEGSWILKKLSNNKIEVTHILLVSPGGKIPDWVINMFIINHPYETHRNLRAMLE